MPAAPSFHQPSAKEFLTFVCEICVNKMPGAVVAVSNVIVWFAPLFLDNNRLFLVSGVYSLGSFAFACYYAWATERRGAIALQEELETVKTPSFDVDFNPTEPSFHQRGVFGDASYYCGAYERYRIAVRNRLIPQRIEVQLISITGTRRLITRLPLSLKWTGDFTGNFLSEQTAFVDVVMLTEHMEHEPKIVFCSRDGVMGPENEIDEDQLDIKIKVFGANGFAQEKRFEIRNVIEFGPDRGLKMTLLQE